jgi:predicted Rossmann fold flavoprotein
VSGGPELPSACDVAIVGAGAAGLAAAVFTRRLTTRSVLLLESATKAGAKILVSGGGRCNVTNAVITDTDFWGGRRTIVRQILRAFPVPDTVAFFRELGVPLHEEADGKLFPDSNRARDVLDGLLRELARTGARLVPGCRVLDVTRERGGFRLLSSHGDLFATAVVLATGGLSLPKTGSDGAGLGIAERLGHTTVPTTPGLAPLVLLNDAGLHRELSGVSHDVELTLWVNGAAEIRLTGALLWTHFGVSGPVVLNASRHWARARIEGKSVAVTLNFFPGRRFEEIDAWLTTLAGARPKASVQAALSTELPASVSAAMVGRLLIGSDPESRVLAHLSRDDRRRLTHALAEWTLPVSETRGYNHAEVTAGGIALGEIDPSTMESRVCPGLFVVGEALDVDGRIGGFNFQWAWASAFVAAHGISSGDCLASRARHFRRGPRGPTGPRSVRSS